MTVHSPVPSPPVVNAPDSHFCLCGVGRESSEAKACSLQVVHFVFLSLPPAVLRAELPCPPGTVRDTLMSLAGGAEQCTNGDTGCWSCREFPAGCCSLLAPQERGSWHCLTYKVDYFYGSLQAGFCKVEQGSFLLCLEALLWVTVNWSLFAAAGWDLSAWFL